MGKNFIWQTAPPQSQDMSAGRLDAMQDLLTSRGTKTLLVIRRDRIVCEWYAPDFGPDRRHYTASLAKALVGGLSLTLTLQDGRLAVDDPAWKYIPAWKGHPEKSRITIRHLATHSSGVEDAEEAGLPHDRLPGWKGAFWRREPDPFSIARDQAPVLFSPGSAYAYSNPGMAMLAYAVTASLRGAPQPDLRSLLRGRIMGPLDLPDETWEIGYGTTYEVDGLPLCANWGGGSYTPRAVASVGRLMLRGGDWEGEQLLAPEWARMAVAYAGTPLPHRPAGDPRPGSGLGWWTNFDGVWESVPKDAFAGAGAGNQILLIVPSLGLIAVRNGASLGEKGEGFWGPVERYLFNPLMEAVMDTHSASGAPCPPSPVIAGVTWAPPEDIVRRATGRGRDGSDNWPLTWADDGHLYTAYGDGYGFDPILPTKLGLGFARVTGGPADFVGENIRSDAENAGMGRSGKKASGLLMVDGVLYMVARNADLNGHACQIARSKDRARTWTWCDWTFEAFGYLTFLNFGQDYAGAPDPHRDHVYLVSHDGPGAYEPADRFILARVPRGEIANRSAYEFFERLRPDGSPVWTTDAHRRGPIFTNPGRCLRSGISYSAPLRRYLWWQQIPGSGPDTRFSGGFGVYDAPEPWGPWTTIYHTPLWDVGPGDMASFPTKWMSDDGRTCHLVFSGNDNFSVRRATFALRE